jgi:alpha-beta hydrolase superfamily lysophospholipase
LGHIRDRHHPNTDPPHFRSTDETEVRVAIPTRDKALIKAGERIGEGSDVRERTKVGCDTRNHPVLWPLKKAHRSRSRLQLITIPVLILHGTLDKATKPSGSQRFYDMAGSTDKTLKLCEGHFHDLLNAIDKEVVMADIQGRLNCCNTFGIPAGSFLW